MAEKQALTGVVMVIPRAIVTDFRANANDKGKVRQWLEVSTEKGKTKFTTDALDLSTLPRLVPLRMEFSLRLDVWGFNPVLIIDQMNVQPL